MARIGSITKVGSATRPFKANLYSGLVLGFYPSVADAQQAFREVHAGRVKFIREDIAAGSIEFYRVEEL